MTPSPRWAPPIVHRLAIAPWCIARCRLRLVSRHRTGALCIHAHACARTKSTQLAGSSAASTAELKSSSQVVYRVLEDHALCCSSGKGAIKPQPCRSEFERSELRPAQQRSDRQRIDKERARVLTCAMHAQERSTTTYEIVGQFLKTTFVRLA